MTRVGLTGGYASGKSYIASELERLGCHVIYADKLGHAVLEPGGGAYQPTIAAFGARILQPDGKIDRKQLGAIVFDSAELLEVLTGFVHPAVFRLEEQMLADFARSDPHGIAVVEAAILIETGRYRVFDWLILTACSEQDQIARGMARDGLRREQVLARMAKQMPLNEKKQYADFVIDTSGPKSATAAQVRQVFEQLRSRKESAQ